MNNQQSKSLKKKCYYFSLSYERILSAWRLNQYVLTCNLHKHVNTTRNAIVLLFNIYLYHKIILTSDKSREVRRYSISYKDFFKSTTELLNPANLMRTLTPHK